MRVYRVLACVSLGLSACATPLETNPSRTATEQLLVNHASQRAAQQFSLALPEGSRVFLDTSYFRGEGADYAAGALRETLLQHGHPLATARADADIVVEARVGALSVDKMNRVIGVPRLTLPISSALNTVTVPELSVYSRRDRQGVAEFAAFAYDAKSGAPVALGGRFSGTTRIRSHTALMIFSWGQQQVAPGDAALDPLPWWRIIGRRNPG